MKEAPKVGELWKHRSNKRVCHVTSVRSTTGANDKAITIVSFKYRRDAAPSAPGLGWKRKTPVQEMPLEDWQRFFTERTSEASRG